MSSNETKPLLSSSGVCAPNYLDEPPPYEEPAKPTPYRDGADLPPYNTAAGPVTTPGGVGQNMFVQCRVCQNIIHVSSSTQTRVIKCTSCTEATPIAPPPTGKKYVRCPCNCLLTCSDAATRVVCPRPNCMRTIGVGTIEVRGINTNRIRVICGRCHKVILWPSNAAIARCPHCRTRSYLYNSWMQCRAFSFLISGICLLVLSIILFGSTFDWAASHGGIFVLWFSGFILGICFLIRSGFYFAMCKSRTEH